MNMLARAACRRAFAFCTACFWLAVFPAMAQENTAPENSLAGQAFRWINFAIVAAAIVYFFAKVAAPALRLRSEEISQKIAEGARAREVAERQRREVQAKLAGIDKEVEAIRAEAKRDMEAEAARLKKMARQEAELIEHAAQDEIFAARRSAQLELKAFAARLAVERAEALLTSQITPEAQAALFQTFLGELERSAN